MNNFFHNDPHCYLAHYTCADTALNHILKKGTLRLGSIENTNDPRETKMWIFSIAGSPKTKKEFNQLKQLAEKNPDFNQILKEGCKVLCMSDDEPNAEKLNFSERCYGKARMWSQYSENHKGICLVFDKEFLSRSLDLTLGSKGKLIGDKVRYWNFNISLETPEWQSYMSAFMLNSNEILEKGLKSVLFKHREKYIKTFFFQKNKDWQTEAEYRWIFLGQNDEPEFIDISDSLKGIVVGCDFPSNLLNEVKYYCERYDAHFSRIRWFNGIPDVTWLAPNELGNSPLFC